MKRLLSFLFFLFLMCTPSYPVSLEIFFRACLEGNTEIIKQGLSEGISPNQIDEKGFTPLCYAAREGEEESVNVLLANGALIEMKTDFPPLHLAAYNNHFSIVKILLPKVKDIYQLDVFGSTVFENALENCNFEICDYLIDNGFDINYEKPNGNNLFSSMLENEETPIDVFLYLIENEFNYHMPEKYYDSILFHAYEKNRLDVVELLFQNNIDINSCTKKNETVLMLAIDDKNSSFAEFLLDNGADPNVCNIYGETALTLAIETGNEYLVNLLVDYKAKCNISLLDACRSGFTRLVEKVIENTVNINEADNYGRTGLMVTNNCEIGKILINNGADINKCDNEGDTALIRAADNQNYELVKFLLENGANVNAVNMSGESALLKTCFSMLEPPDPRIIDVLIHNGANPKVYSQKHGTCIYSAVLSRVPIETIELLISYGASVDVINDLNPLKVAVEYENYELVSILLNAGADANYIDTKGENLLFSLYFHNKTESINIVKKLLEYGIDVNQQNDSGYTLLHKASLSYNYDFARLLLSLGVNPNIQDYFGNTPLYLAVQTIETIQSIASIQGKEVTNDDYNLCIDFLSLLLHSGANPSIRNSYGDSVWTKVFQVQDDIIKDCFINNCLIDEPLSYRKACTDKYTNSSIFMANVKISSITKVIENFPKRIIYRVIGQIDGESTINITVNNSIDFIINDTIICYLRFVECDDNQIPCFEYIKLIDIK